jgi:DNA-directed RNA polymerase specialized sigma24 family protein
VDGYEQLSDERLLALTPRDPAAFDAFYLRHERLVLAWARKAPAEELLAYLPAHEADAVRARVIEELSYAELAERLRCSPLVARKRVSRGLRTLRTLVELDDV